MICHIFQDNFRSRLKIIAIIGLMSLICMTRHVFSEFTDYFCYLGKWEDVKSLSPPTAGRRWSHRRYHEQGTMEMSTL
jgi:hypothetical protein